MEISQYGQITYKTEADTAFPQGCTEGNNSGGECDWCQVYYGGQMPRFTFIQRYNEYTDYDTVLGNLTESDLSETERVEWAGETLRRLTFVDDGEKPRYAYVVERNGTDRRITWEEGEALLGHPCDASLEEACSRV